MASGVWRKYSGSVSWVHSIMLFCILGSTTGEGVGGQLLFITFLPDRNTQTHGFRSQYTSLFLYNYIYLQ